MQRNVASMGALVAFGFPMLSALVAEKLCGDDSACLAVMRAPLEEQWTPFGTIEVLTTSSIAATGSATAFP